MGDDERGGAAGAETSDIGAVAAPGRERRMTAGRKRDAVLRVLRGEPLEIVARELAVTAADLSGWRDAFLEAGCGQPEVAGAGRSGRDDRPAADQGRRADHGHRAAPREDRAAGGRGRRPFCGAEVEAMSTVISISTRRRYGVARVCRVWGVARAGVYRRRARGGCAACAAAQAGAAGADVRRRAGRGDPAGAHRQPVSRRGLPQGLGAAAPCGPAHLEGAGAPPDARERPVGGDPHGPPPRPAQP